jgi:hypothetical protein
MGKAKAPKTIISVYGGAVVNMDYLIARGVPDKQRFSLAAMRAIDNAGKGYVVEDGKVFSVSSAYRSAKIVTDPEERSRVLAMAGAPAMPPGTTGGGA